TEPPFPGLRTRTERLLFSGLICVAEERPIAFCSVSALCVDDCTPPEPVEDWLAVCVGVAVFVAAAVEAASFDCDTEPSLPGLSTRTEMFWFEGSIWVALDAARAPCSVDDDCVADCTGLEANAEPAITAKTATVAASAMIHRFMESLS